MLSETDKAIGNLEVEMETMDKLKNGEAPPPPTASAEGEKATTIAEPVIKIVEV